ncbi:hypothetical protein M0Q97_06565 [Candidatus Dojkabacteria bacterium]|jgi:hypothetical protein|nr:hypothetical protein [Candidatus Dojkabacteria bacterium]
MKIRNGFVSNSSSSSFMIISKNGELTTNILMKSFKIDKESPLYNVAKDIAKDLKSLSRKYTKDDFLKEFANSEKDLEEDYPSLYEIYKKIDYHIYYAMCDDVDYPLLYNLNIDYEDDNILIKKDE